MLSFILLGTALVKSRDYFIFKFLNCTTHLGFRKLIVLQYLLYSCMLKGWISLKIYFSTPHKSSTLQGYFACKSYLYTA